MGAYLAASWSVMAASSSHWQEVASLCLSCSKFWKPWSYAFRCCDLRLDPMALIHKLDIDILKMYLCTEDKLFGSRLSKVRAWQTDRRTDRCDWKYFHTAFTGGRYYHSLLFVTCSSVIADLLFMWLCALCVWNKGFCFALHKDIGFSDSFDSGTKCRYYCHCIVLLFFILFCTVG